MSVSCLYPLARITQWVDCAHDRSRDPVVLYASVHTTTGPCANLIAVLLRSRPSLKNVMQISKLKTMPSQSPSSPFSMGIRMPPRLQRYAQALIAQTAPS
jgi:hypothetical protein